MREPTTIGGIQIRRLSRMTDQQLHDIGKYCMQLYRERKSLARQRRQVDVPALRDRGMTVQEIADRVGLTRQRVSQLLADADRRTRQKAIGRSIGERYGLVAAPRPVTS